MLKGYRTILTGWVTVLIPVLAMLEIKIDPEAAIRLVNEFFEWFALGFGLLGGLITWFRKLA